VKYAGICFIKFLHKVLNTSVLVGSRPKLLCVQHLLCCALR